MLNGGNFRLDGGAMHGVVPKTLWSKLVSCDALNRCSYSTRCLLVEVGDRRVLVETGNGDKFSPKLKEIYGIDHDRAIGVALREVGLKPDDIDAVVMTHLHFDHSGGRGGFALKPDDIDPVVMTHLHFDHSGGTTRRTPSGGLEPLFRKARHVVQR